MSLLLSYSVVKEPTSAKGRQSCQTLTSVSSGSALLPVEPTRLTRTRLPLEIAAGKDLRARTASPLAGTGECTFRLPLCQLRLLRCAATSSTGSVPRIMDNPSTLAAIPARFAAQPAVQIRVMACFPKIPYRSGTSRNDPTSGPIPSISVRRPPARNGPRPWPCRGRNRTSPLATDAAPHR